MLNVAGNLHGHRLVAVAGIAAVLLSLPRVVTAEPDEATKERCAAYAKRAVEQYQLMKSHPGCDAHLDALSWRDDYGYHYNGCIVFGKGATTLSDQARDGHLRACGAVSDAGTAAGAGDSPGAPVGPAAAEGAVRNTTGGIAASTASTASTSPPSANAGAGPPESLVTPAPGFGGIGCHDGPPAGSLTGQVSGAGRFADLKGNVLTYHGSPPVTSQTSGQTLAAMPGSLGQYPLTTSIVARPKYYSSCRGIPAVSALGPWISAAAPGQPPRFIWIDLGGVLSWQQITPEAAKAFLSGSAAIPAKPDKASTSTKSPAPVKPAH